MLSKACCLFWATVFYVHAVSVIVAPSDDHPVFEGWGTSICWWGNIVGNYSDAVRDTIVDLVFDTADGLGMNIVRYNIGGGDAPSHNHMGTGKEMEGFLDGESSAYDWTKDAPQRRILHAAKERIPGAWFIAEAFSNSPPYWMTVSGCASGASGGGDNLKSDSYGLFADYLTHVVKQFRDEWGIFFRTIEPFNEPSGNWWKSGGGQEGCHFSRANQVKLVAGLHESLVEKQLATEIAAPDEYGYDITVESYEYFDAATRSSVSQINTHGYSGSKRSELRRLATEDGKRLWASEIDGSGAPSPFDVWAHNHDDIAPGLDIAQRIIRDFREMSPEGWIFWQVVESEQAQISLNKNWGCIHVDYTGGERYYLCKKYHAMKQFTKFIRPLSRMVDIEDDNAIAFMSEERNRLTIVQRNASTAAVSYEYDLSRFEGAGSLASVWRTSSTENAVRCDDMPVYDGILAAPAQPQSVTTYCIDIDNVNVSVHAGAVFGAVPESAHPLRICRDGAKRVLMNNVGAETVNFEVFDLCGKRLRAGLSTPGKQPLLQLPSTTRALIVRFRGSDRRWMSSLQILQ